MQVIPNVKDTELIVVSAWISYDEEAKRHVVKCGHVVRTIVGWIVDDNGRASPVVHGRVPEESYIDDDEAEWNTDEACVMRAYIEPERRYSSHGALQRTVMLRDGGKGVVRYLDGNSEDEQLAEAINYERSAVESWLKRDVEAIAKLREEAA